MHGSIDSVVSVYMLIAILPEVSQDDSLCEPAKVSTYA